jgi:hypothetical protein
MGDAGLPGKRLAGLVRIGYQKRIAGQHPLLNADSAFLFVGMFSMLAPHNPG